MEAFEWTPGLEELGLEVLLEGANLWGGSALDAALLNASSSQGESAPPFLDPPVDPEEPLTPYWQAEFDAEGQTASSRFEEETEPWARWGIAGRNGFFASPSWQLPPHRDLAVDALTQLGTGEPVAQEPSSQSLTTATSTEPGVGVSDQALVAALDFNEGSGTVAADSSPEGQKLSGCVGRLRLR